MRYHRMLVVGSAALAGLSLITATPVSADAVSAFYSGKTVIFVSATGPSGDYALYSRLMERHIGRHIPGSPKVQIQFMPGAGGVVAANHMYHVAAKDGTVIGMPLSSIALNQVLRPDRIRYDAGKFSYIGVIVSLPDVIAVWHTANVRSLEDARKTTLNIASTGTSAQNYLGPKLVNALLGTKFNLIAGYGDSGAMDQAIENGEVHGRLIAWQTWMLLRPGWIKEKKVIPLIQAGDFKMSELPDVPSFIDLVKGQDEERMVEMLHATTQISRAVYGPPQIPDDRLAALRRAFDSLMKDPIFLEDAKARGMALRPRSGEEMAKLVARLLDTPESVVARFKKVTGFGG